MEYLYSQKTKLKGLCTSVGGSIVPPLLPESLYLLSDTCLDAGQSIGGFLCRLCTDKEVLIIAYFTEHAVIASTVPFMETAPERHF